MAEYIKHFHITVNELGAIVGAFCQRSYSSEVNGQTVWHDAPVEPLVQTDGALARLEAALPAFNTQAVEAATRAMAERDAKIAELDLERSSKESIAAQLEQARSEKTAVELELQSERALKRPENVEQVKP